MSKFLHVGVLKMMTIASAIVLSGCVSIPPSDPNVPLEERVTAFSRAPITQTLPAGWQPWIMSKLTKKTEYKLVVDNGVPVIEANAESSASGILQEVSINPLEKNYITWRWKAPALIPNADNSRRSGDDSPVRIVIAFDGDKKKFDFEDRAMADLVRLFSGREMPYATLMYIWENKLRVNTILENSHSSRARMLVAESGPARIGQWLTMTRNIAEDYRKAFDEEPGKIISVGIMTDTNSTSSKITAYYGDIGFSKSLAAPRLNVGVGSAGN